MFDTDCGNGIRFYSEKLVVGDVDPYFARSRNSQVGKMEKVIVTQVKIGHTGGLLHKDRGCVLYLLKTKFPFTQKPNLIFSFPSIV